MKNITSTIETEEHLGNLQPKDPWDFAKTIERTQTVESTTDGISLLFNKGRYFEMSVYDHKLLVSISKAVKIKIECRNMLCGSWRKLEAPVRAFNKRGVYVRIDVDWV